MFVFELIKGEEGSAGVGPQSLAVLSRGRRVYITHRPPRHSLEHHTPWQFCFWASVLVPWGWVGGTVIKPVMSLLALCSALRRGSAFHIHPPPRKFLVNTASCPTAGCSKVRRTAGEEGVKQPSASFSGSIFLPQARYGRS